jgi:hypothetical protein
VVWCGVFFCFVWGVWGGGGGGGCKLVNIPRKFKFVTDLTKLTGTLKSYMLMVTLVARM